MFGNDFFLYFASNYVEQWHEFESYSAFELFSDIGGTMGLLLGLSLITIVEVAGRMAMGVTERIRKVVG